jgi:hypothetical protein
MRDLRTDRAGAAVGILAVVVFVVAFLITGSPPKPADSDKAVQAFLIDKRGALLTQAWLICLAAMLFLWYITAVRSVLRDAEGETGQMSNLFFGAAVLGIALVLLAGVFQIALVHKVSGSVTPETARFGYDLGSSAIAMNSMAFALATAVFAFVVLQTAVLPRWTVALALLTAVTSIIQTLTIGSRTGFFSLEGTYGIIPFLLAMVWTVGTSVAMLRELNPQRARAGEARPATT